MSNARSNPADRKLDVARDLISFWWFFGVGGEKVTSTVRCQVVGCRTPASPVDVYCPDLDHSDLLLFHDRPIGRMRWWLVNVVRAIVVGLVVLAAAAETAWPIYVLAVAAGLVCIWLPLHDHPGAAGLGVTWWAIVAVVGGSIAAADVGSGGLRLVWTLVVGLPLALTMCSVFVGPLLVTEDEPAGVEREAARGVAGSLALATLAALTWWLTTGPLADRFVNVPDVVERWLLFASLGSVLGTVLVAAVGALLVSFGALNLNVPPRIGSLPGRRRVTWTFRPRPQPARHARPTTLGRIGLQMSIAVRQLTNQFRRSIVALARQTVNGLLAFLNASQRAGCRLINWVDRRIRIFARRVLFVVRRGARLLGRGAGFALVTAIVSIAPLITYGAGIAGVVAALALADEFTEYLVDGPLAALFAGAGWAGVGVAATFVIWERLSGVTTAAALRSEHRFLTRIAPDVAFFTIAAGWVVGIPGTLGYGPIRVGWVTVVGTAVLAVLVGQEEVLDWRSQRRLRRTAAVSGNDPAISPKGP